MTNKKYTYEQKLELFKRNQNLMKNCADFEDCPEITFDMIENGEFAGPQCGEPLSWELIEDTLNSYPGY